MGFCPCKNRSFEKNSDLCELERRELALRCKEKLILKKDKILQNKIKKYKQRDNKKAKADSQAAAKLRKARRKLLQAVDMKDNVERYNKKKKESKKRKTKSIRDTLKIASKQVKTKKGKQASTNPFKYLKDLLNEPCNCTYNQQRKKQNQLEKAPESFFKSIFGRPCSCQSGYKNKSCPLKLNPCRCARALYTQKECHWQAAAGDCYLMSLRSHPQLWLYHHWPQLYPQYLCARNQWKNMGYVLLFLAGIVFWTPCFLFLVICKCLFCVCCSDC